MFGVAIAASKLISPFWIWATSSSEPMMSAPAVLTQCGFEGDALDNALASVERYNELAKAGSDDDFGKPASRMFALENPPYYACQWGTTSMLVCVGGLESDENCHTFTEEDPASPKRDIIKGLYVCGNVQGSRYAVEYPICMRGISHSLCVYLVT